ncbi:MAG: phage holin family protein [Chitinophagaceae bacterium]|nr:phage holin family protein [Chitinophagaceae bacterium]
MNFIIKILITAINAFVLAYILPGVIIDDYFTAIIVAVVLSILNALVKPLLILLTLPATVLTLGLFLFVINACIILISDHFIGGFQVNGFWYALLFSLLLSFFNSFIQKRIFSEEENK